MAAGDTHRIWFPDMLNELKQSWSDSMSWEELAEFCERMSEMRRRIRESRGIKPVSFRCPKCGEESLSDGGDVSIRSALFALRKAGIIAEAQFKAHEKQWRQYRKMRGLDAYGRNVEHANQREESHTCG
jgi:DNA-binding transcriptional ArsR family regulator